MEGGPLRLFTADGRMVQSLSQLAGNGPYIVVGSEPFNVEEFLLALETSEGKPPGPLGKGDLIFKKSISLEIETRFFFVFFF